MAPVSTRLCIVGGGPAGMMAGLLFARAGIDVTVLEKHADFLRDFRGDTIHPSTLDLMDELGLSERFRALPQCRAETFSGVVAGRGYRVADSAGCRPATVSCRSCRNGISSISSPARPCATRAFG